MRGRQVVPSPQSFVVQQSCSLPPVSPPMEAAGVTHIGTDDTTLVMSDRTSVYAQRSPISQSAFRPHGWAHTLFEVQRPVSHAFTIIRQRAPAGSAPIDSVQSHERGTDAIAGQSAQVASAEEHASTLKQRSWQVR
jgi:hypothetical protein